ncbi:MAG: pentapeptide repeat-containing protein [Alphaproteobacteria bacterium]|nr:pentapeptide repeat-containing protein [Alphaproteobacteria bacterium]
MRGADLGGANLRGADLDEANLTGANLYKADLTGANLSKADLAGVLFALDSLLCTATFFKGAIHLDSAEFYTEEGKRIIGLTIGRDGRLCAEEKPRAKQKTRKTRAQFGASAQGDAPAEGNVVHAADLDFVPKLPAAPAAAPKAAPG